VILLGIETATELVGVAVADDRGPRAAVWTTGRRRHAESLAPAIAHVLEQAGLSLPDLDGVAVDLGPGLFTGLRVGVATAKGLAQGLGLGLLGLTSLEVLAHAAYGAGWPGPVVAVVDARRGEVFAARYAPPASGSGTAMVESSPPARFTPEALAAELAGRPGSSAMLAVGDGARRYQVVLGEVAGLRIAGPASPPPDALVALAAERLAAGAAPARPEAVRPVYLREADAQINWAQRQGSGG
jgi:tRNA threonylcarbamoyladenosine biosynthesis protein TsaB